MFDIRSREPERIDTGDYTPEEYERFLTEIAFINRYLGDGRALKHSLLKQIKRAGPKSFSVLDVGCGSGELLRMIADHADGASREVSLVGIDLNPISSEVTHTESKDYAQIVSVRGDAFNLPFADASFDFAISSLFFHHLSDAQIVDVLHEMSRVARRGIFVIDLHRRPAAYALYKLFCFGFRMSPMVNHDGSLSITKGFRRADLRRLARAAGLKRFRVKRVFPYRLVLKATL